jgi:hypothetical protein
VVLKQRDRDGWCLTVRLTRDNRRRVVTVHKLVLGAFVGPRPVDQECCHGDGDYTNNRLENLRWDTDEANIRDQVRHGTHRHASRERCIRGHLLVAPNLLRWRPDYPRRCKSCSNGWSAHTHHGADVAEHADAFYAKLDLE